MSPSRIYGIVGLLALAAIAVYAAWSRDRATSSILAGTLLLASAFWPPARDGLYTVFVAGGRIRVLDSRGRWIRALFGLGLIAVGAGLFLFGKG
jgi:hypothetical protein